MKISISNTLLFFSLSMTIGCVPSYYAPTLMNTPNFREKGDIYFAAHGGINGDANGGDVQAAYAIGEHVAVQGNYMACSTKNKNTEGSISAAITKGALGELAIGYFSPLSKQITFGLYGGYGLGKVTNDWKAQGASSAHFNKLFIQPTISLQIKHIEFITSFKLANLTYYNLSQNYTNQDFINGFDALKKPIPILESGYAVRFGGKRVKFQIQGTSMRLFRPIPAFRYEEGSLGLGICVLLNKNRDF